MGTYGSFGALSEPVATYGDFWGPLGTYGGLWGPLGTDGDLWGLMWTFGHLWGPVGTYGDLWGLFPDSCCFFLAFPCWIDLSQPLYFFSLGGGHQFFTHPF